MDAIASLGRAGAAVWSEVARRAQAWIADAGLSAPDVVVLVPAIEHVALARRAWVQSIGRGLLPRIETVASLAESLVPPPVPAAGEHGGDSLVNRLNAAQLMAQMPWAQAWAEHDRRAFDHMSAQLSACADALALGRAACMPAARAAWLETARAALGESAHGPMAAEAMLARVALEWVAASSAVPRTDALFALDAAAWLQVRVGGGDAVGNALVDAAHARGVPAAVIEADAAIEAALAHCTAPRLVRCRDLEEEAQRTADVVLAKVAALPAAKREPVALVALDRLLVRRVHALLVECGAQVSDETGWKLSTTRAAAAVMAWLRAARATATSEELLAALKHGWADADAAAADVPALERWLRVHRIAHAWRRVPSADARAPWQRVRDLLRPLAGDSPPAPLMQWLARLRAVLEATGTWRALQADAAGGQAVAALRLDDDASAADSAWHHACQGALMSLDEFTALVDSVFEATIFKPPAPAGEPDVVIAALPRVLLRPFSALVMPGCDETHLDAMPPAVPLIGDALARRLGVADAAQRRETEQRAFGLALAHADVTLLYRTNDADRVLAASALLHRLEFALARRGQAAMPADDLRVLRAAAAAPARRPAPPLDSALLPAQWSATAYEALRNCPYRFVALHAMRLREEDELDDTVTRREWGQWLHATLLDYHTRRGANRPADPAEDEALLVAAGRAQCQAQGLDDARFLPWWAEFEPLARDYVRWWRDDEAAGARFEEGEQARTATLDGDELAPPVALRGVVDRLDLATDEAGQRHARVLDYKTGDVAALKRTAKSGAEDTQLAFYALLQGGGVPDASLRAAYLPLRRGHEIKPIAHEDVARSAAQLRAGLRSDVARMARGAGLPALGAGPVCEHCAARGLCRRDFWSDES